VVFSWLTNATFGAAMKGHVVLLDSFVTRLEDGTWAHAAGDSGSRGY
jgi:hypothetical protein